MFIEDMKLAKYVDVLLVQNGQISGNYSWSC